MPSISVCSLSLILRPLTTSGFGLLPFVTLPPFLGFQAGGFSVLSRYISESLSTWFLSSGSVLRFSIMPRLAVIKSSVRRSKLTDHVRRGPIMPTPCSSYRRFGKECRVDLSSGRCAECISGGCSCDLVVTDSDCGSHDPSSPSSLIHNRA